LPDVQPPGSGAHGDDPTHDLVPRHERVHGLLAGVVEHGQVRGAAAAGVDRDLDLVFGQLAQVQHGRQAGGRTLTAIPPEVS
jgi:hypothetical protein